MKKIISVIAILFAILIIFMSNVYAATLDSLTVQTDKTTLKPGEEVKVTVTFGQTLGAYTFNFAYDSNVFEYVSVDGGTANNTGNTVKVAFFDSTGGTNPRSNMSIIFRAKTGITGLTPTSINVTAEGLANADASVTYDDITTPIVKNITVEPEQVTTPPTNSEEVNPPEQTPSEPETSETETKEEQKPAELPKTGINLYMPIIATISAILILIIIVKNIKK